MRSGAKGSFFDRLRIRLIRILKKLRIIKSNINTDEIDDLYKKRLKRKKQEEELYNYYKNRNNKKLYSNVVQKKKNNAKNKGIEQKNIEVINKHKYVLNRNCNINELKLKSVEKNDKKGVKLFNINQTEKLKNVNLKIPIKDNRILNKSNIETNKKNVSNAGVLKNNNVIVRNNNIRFFSKPTNTKLSIKHNNKFKKIKNIDVKKSESKMTTSKIVTKAKKSSYKIVKDKKTKKSFSIKNLDLTKFNKINNELDKKLLKQKEICKEFNKLINEITPEKQINIKYNFINNLFSNIKNLFISVISIPFLKNPKNIPLFSIGLYMLNNSVRNMRKLITKEERIKFIPSNIYIDAIKENIDNLNLIDYMVTDSLSQISHLKYEYQNEFSDYKDNEKYIEIMNKLESYEAQLKGKQEKIYEEKQKMDNTLDKNCKKLQLIKNMNN